MTQGRLWLWLPWAAFVALAAGWIAYWHVLAGESERRLAAWVSEQSARGAHASYTRVARHGFPVLLRLELQGFSYAPERGGWRARTARVDLHVQMLNPGHIKLEARAPIEVARAGGATTIFTADALIGSWRTERGALAVAGIEADNLSLDDPAQEGRLLARKLVANIRPDPRAAGAYQLAFDADGLTLPRPVRSFETFGLEVASLRAAMVVEQGAALMASASQDPLGPWREAGGQLRFDALTLNWGPLETTGRGNGGLDAQRRLVGEIELPIDHPARVLSALANGPNVDRDARRALALLAAGYALSGDDIKLNVEARDGVLRLEGLSVRTLPPVY
jgi:hypothetical protein